jgi:iron complex transport system substrate-binding protein
MPCKHPITILLASLLLVPSMAACGPAQATVVVQPTATQPTLPPPIVQPTEPPFSAAVTDALGATVTLSGLPVRIVSATLGTDEMLLDLVAPERIAALSAQAADPAASAIAARPELAQVANILPSDPGPEQFASLSTDLVLVTTSTDPALIAALHAASLPVFAVADPQSIQDIQQNILTIGGIVGEPERAAYLIDQMNGQLATVADAAGQAGGEKPSVLVMDISQQVAGAGTLADDIITRAGGVNAAAGLTGWAQPGDAAIVQMNPDYVIVLPTRSPRTRPMPASQPF